VEEAEAILEPIVRRQAVPASDYLGLCITRVEIALARGRIQDAFAWCRTLRFAMPDLGMHGPLWGRIARRQAGAWLSALNPFRRRRT
jgi:hypothetical protein